MKQEVILRDFDGSETILEKAPPLPEVIQTGETDISDSAILTARLYVRTADTDREGRTIYRQSNL